MRNEDPMKLAKVDFPVTMRLRSEIDNTTHYTQSCHIAFVAQGLEHWSCKPGVESSNLSEGFCVFHLQLGTDTHSHSILRKELLITLTIFLFVFSY